MEEHITDKETVTWKAKISLFWTTVIIFISTQTNIFHVKELYQQCIPLLCNMWVEARCNIFSATTTIQSFEATAKLVPLNTGYETVTHL